MKRSGWTELVLGCTLLASGSTAAAESYYVSPTGSATAAGTTGDPWSLEKANAEAQPGDTIVLLDGNYSTSIAPARSGSDGAPITFVAANEHQATFSDGFASAPAVLLTGRGHVIVDGIKSVNVSRWVRAESGAHHITIRNCFFKDADGWESMRFRATLGRITVSGCHIENGTDSLHIRGGEQHLVENNTFVEASHTCLVLMAVKRSVVRGNRLSNAQEKCMEVFSLRDAYDPPQKSEYNLIEGNVFGPTSLSGIQYAGNRSILRRNVFVDGAVGMNWAHYGGSDPSDDPEAWWVEENRFYNNVIYGCEQAVLTTTLLTLQGKGGVTRDNVMRNNIIAGGTSDQQVVIHWDAVPTDVTFVNNNIRYDAAGGDLFWWLDKPGDDQYFTLAEIEGAYPGNYSGNVEHAPGFVDAPGGDFHLAQDSPCIDAGAPLTTTSAAGSGVEVPVVDPLYFTDGHGLIPPDLIQVGGERVTIVAVDYPGKLLTVNRSIAWTAAAPVWSAFNGEGPDLGAFESGVPAGGDGSPPGDGSSPADGGSADARRDGQQGDGDNAVEDEGCGCRTGGSRADAGLGALLLVLLLATTWSLRSHVP